MSDQPLTIIGVTVENFMNIRVVRLNGLGKEVVITGENGAGKTSLMRSVKTLLLGKRSAPEMPVRAGKKNSRVVVETEEFTFTEVIPGLGKKGSYHFEMKAKDGKVLNAPRGRLDELLADGVAIEPLKLMSMSPSEKREEILKLIGVDLGAFTRRHDEAYEERRKVNGELKTTQARLGEEVEAPDDEVSLEALSEELSTAKDLESANRRQGRKAGELQDSAERLSEHRDRAAARVADALREVASSEKHLETAKKQEADAKTVSKAAVAGLAKLADPDPGAIIRRIREAEGINRKVRARKSWIEGSMEAKALEQQSAAFSRAINTIEDEKLAALADAKMPVKGLTVDDEGLWLDGVPLEQIETSRVIQVCVKIAAAKKPRLSVAFVENGNDLTDKTYLAFTKACAEVGIKQLWIERLSAVGDAGVIRIEEGEVAP